MILSIRTDKPQAEIGLFDGQKQVDYYIWEAHRNLSSQIHQKIEDLLNKNGQKYQDIKGIIVFQGPGSFTGLRIGVSVANALAYGLKIPVSAASGDDWTDRTIEVLARGKGKPMDVPFYGQAVKVTSPRK
ncbi:tRNA (adenosine(37)-N6)-threonylcarbamoyltransferase complex dimerization subunit type 1 TsaB [Candidatus Parcubacteria bacterium]|nr:tRNA (adenosine(37)-N6)-threonylcarbamoyltransferase complex dimerization subunit type 1 TsaB [Candidatus Parcubacteria bacterium]